MLCLPKLHKDKARKPTGWAPSKAVLNDKNDKMWMQKRLSFDIGPKYNLSRSYSSLWLCANWSCKRPFCPFLVLSPSRSWQRWQFILLSKLQLRRKSIGFEMASFGEKPFQVKSHLSKETSFPVVKFQHVSA